MRRITIAAVVAGCAAAAGAFAATARTTGSSSWTIHDLGTLRGLDAAPVAMDERGDIAGYAYGRNVAGRAFVWTHGRIVDLGRCGADSRALAINAAGTVVGSCGLRPGGKAEHAFLWRTGKATDLGAFGWSSSAAVAINDRGDVVGDVYRGNIEHAFLWRAGRMTDLGTLPSRARA
jgi:probable HAF family extracellular repeat protein